ncbi:MAG TPA: PLD nuclease N-terminal domain-containing protein [Longimicrobiales bacterium]|nr:PLD nuclease N-terminal domain-containing protein [Longimicrobiales bacterium]
MRAVLALTVFALDVGALLSILRARSTVGRKLAWTAAVVALPLAGAAAWLTVGRARQRSDAALT